MWDEILKWLHVHKSSKKGRMKIKPIAMFIILVEHHHHFVFKRVSHSTKSSYFWWLVMIHATSTPVRCASNTINVNKWNFTSLVSKVTSIEIAHYHLMIPWLAIETGFVSLLWIGHESYYLHLHLENKTHHLDE